MYDNPCKHGGKCIAKALGKYSEVSVYRGVKAGYECECPEGWTGDNCENNQSLFDDS